MKSKMKKEDKVDTRLRWRKLHGGAHYHSDGQVVKKGEILRARPNEMSKVIQAGFECLDTFTPEEMDQGTQLMIKMVSPGKYNVINPRTKKPINSVPISKKAAEAFGVFDEEKGD